MVLEIKTAWEINIKVAELFKTAPQKEYFAFRKTRWVSVDSVLAFIKEQSMNGNMLVSCEADGGRRGFSPALCLSDLRKELMKE